MHAAARHLVNSASTLHVANLVHLLHLLRLHLVRPGLPFACALPLLALCAVSAPILDDLLTSELRARLARVLPGHQSICDLTVHPMRRRPGSRHVFSYKLVVGDQKTGKQNVAEFVAKRDTTRAVGKAAKEFDALRLLWDAGFGQQGRLLIPQPVHHFEDLRLIVQGKARGTRLRSHLGAGTESSIEDSRASALWLATMHRLPAGAARTCSYTSEKESIRRFSAALAADQAPLAAIVRHYAALIERLLDGFRDVPATWVHGDFHPDHIFVDHGNVTVIDFERFCIADPARDLGSFIAHMRTTACFSSKPLEAVNREIDAFLATYLGLLDEAQAAAISGRVAPFVALSCLEALYYVASVLKVTQPARLAMYVNCLEQSGLAPFDEPASAAGFEGGPR